MARQYNRTNYVRGERHHRAKLTTSDVDLIRELHDQTPLGYRAIAQKFECGISTVRDIVKCRTRTRT